MNSRFILELAPPSTLARRFQYALLSLGDPLNLSYQVNLERGIVIFDSYGSYVDLVEKAKDMIRETMTIERSEEGCVTSIVASIDCCKLDQGPSLYRTGKNDLKMLRDAGLTGCMYTSRKGEKVIAWNHSAVSYIDIIVNGKSHPSGKKFSLPFLGKLTLYSSVRGPTSFEDTVNFHTLGSVLLGGSLAFIGRERQLKEGKWTNVEIYLIPETHSPAFTTLRNLLLAKPIAGNTTVRISWQLSQELNISFDIASSLSLAMSLYKSMETGRKIAKDPDFLTSSTLLAVIESGKYRPDMRSMLPLSSLIYKTYSQKTVENIVKLVYSVRRGDSRKRKRSSRAGEGKSKVKESLGKLLPGCIQAMYLQALGGRNSDHLYQCIRDLSSQVIQHRDDKEEEARILLNMAQSLVHSLRRDLLSIYGQKARAR